MKWNTILPQALCVSLTALLYLSYVSVESHTQNSSNKPEVSYTIYTLDNKKTDLIYHLDSGTVSDKNKVSETVYKYAHIICNTTPPDNTIGYINKNHICYYVYTK